MWVFKIERLCKYSEGVVSNIIMINCTWKTRKKKETIRKMKESKVWDGQNRSFIVHHKIKTNGINGY